MRGDERVQRILLSYVALEDPIPAAHPFWVGRPMVDAAPQALSLGFAALSARTGRPSVPPK